MANLNNQIENEAIELFKNGNKAEALELLEAEYRYVREEGNKFGVFFYDENDTTVYFIRYSDFKFFELEENWTHEVYYDGTDIVNYTIQIFENTGLDEEIYANINWNESVFYYDESYPDWLVQEWEPKEDEEENWYISTDYKQVNFKTGACLEFYQIRAILIEATGYKENGYGDLETYLRNETDWYEIDIDLFIKFVDSKSFSVIEKWSRNN